MLTLLFVMLSIYKCLFFFRAFIREFFSVKQRGEKGDTVKICSIQFYFFIVESSEMLRRHSLRVNHIENCLCVV